MRKSLALAVAAGSLVAGVGALAPTAATAASCTATSGASTCDSSAAVSATVGGTGLDGTRTITTATAGALVPNVTSGTADLTGTLAVTVTETAKLGKNPWSVTAAAGTLTDSTTDTIAPANLAMGAATAPAGVGCLTLTQCTAAAGSGGTLDSARTLFTINGESSTVAYTGAYAGSAPLTLTVPNGTPSGLYSGTITVTLVQ